MKVFPTIAEHVEMIKATFKELRETYEKNHSEQKDPFDGLQDL